MSPIPVTKKAPPPAATVIEPRTKPKPEKKSRAGLWFTLAATMVLLAGGGGYYLKVLNPNLLANKPIVTPAGRPDSVVAPTQAPIATNPVADSNPIPAAVAVVDSAKIKADRADSIRAVKAAAKKDSIRLASAVKAAERRLRDSIAQATKAAADAANAEKPSTVVKLNSAPVSVVAPPATPPTPQAATIKIASRTPNAALYINNNIDGLISAPKDVTIPAGVQVKISIRKEGCVSWDTTIFVTAGTNNRIGNRQPKCE